MTQVALEDHPELAGLVEDAVRRGTEVQLTRGGSVVATLTPCRAELDALGRDINVPLDRGGLERSFGGWHDVDADELIRDIYAARDASEARALPEW